MSSLVISLHRVVRPHEGRVEKVSQRELEIDQFGLPFGVLMTHSLVRFSHTILEADQKGLIDLGSVDLVHAHKLTFEGQVGSLIAQRLGRPLAVSLRSTDVTVLRYRRDLRAKARKILSDCSVIFYIAPWLQNEVRKLLGDEFYTAHMQRKMVFLPNSVFSPLGSSGQEQRQEGRVLTILRMDHIKAVRNKNVRRLLKALAMTERGDIRLDVVGDGPCRPIVEKWARRFGVAAKVTFLGLVPNQQLGVHYARAQAFLLPSISETFGLVFAEALMHGTPILYARSTGFDGMFKKVGVAVAARSVRSIASGIDELITNNRAYRENIERLRDSGAFEIFAPTYPAEVYKKTLGMLTRGADRARAAGIAAGSDPAWRHEP